jgi:hypothetical protein
MKLSFTLLTKTLLLTLLLGLGITQSFAAIINVSPGANAIQNAVNAASAGDTLLLSNGTYNESVNLANASGGITVLAANAGGAIVNGGAAAAFSASQHSHDITLSGLTLRSSSTNGAIAVLHIIDHSGRLAVSNSTFDAGSGTKMFTTGIKVENDLPNIPTRVSILDNTFGPFDNDELIQIQTENATSGGDVDIVIDGNSNSGLMEDGAVEIDIDRNALTAIIVVRNNGFSNWAGTGPGINVRLDGQDLEAHVLIEDNIITGPDGNGIMLDVAAISSEVYAEINSNTIAGNANTDTGILVDDESGVHSTDIVAFVTRNIISNTLQSGIRVRPFNDVASTVNRFQVVIDGNNISNPNTDLLPVNEEAGVDISDDSGINRERYEVDVEITNNTFSNINASTACILIEEPITMTAGVAEVEYLISGNTGCAAPVINGSPVAVADPVPASSALGSIGDFVWDDINLDGVQDMGEPGVAGVIISFTNGSFSGTTTTTSDGSYVIPSLLTGTYTLTINPTAALPFITDQGIGGDATKDSDFDPMSQQATVMLAAGADNVDIDGGLKATNCPVITHAARKIDEGCPGPNDGSITFGTPMGGMAPYTYSVDSGRTYVMGTTISNLAPGVYQTRVMDDAGCESDAISITVGAGVDALPPVIACPANQTAIVGSNCDALLIEYTPSTLADNCSQPSVDQRPTPFTAIAANTSVTLIATDASGNVDSCSFMVMLRDTTAPVILGGASQMASLSPSADASLWEDNPGNNAGANTLLHAGVSNAGSKRRSLIKFDIAGSIPAAAIIDSVKLILSITGGNASNPSNYDLFASLKDWGEGTKGGNTGSAASAGEVTWLSNFHNTSTWAAPGGQAGTDYASSPSATANVAGRGTYTWSGMTADVQSWLNNPPGNFGWFLITQSENVSGTARRFNSNVSFG